MKRRKGPYPEVTQNRSKGRLYWRFRVPGFSCNIPGPWGSPAFKAAYEAALDGSRTPKANAAPGTLAWLIEQKLGSLGFRNLSASRKRSLRGELDWLRREAGDLPFARLKVRHIEALMAKKAGPAAANGVKKNLSMLFNFAVKKLDYEGQNPARSADRLEENPDGWHTWTLEEIDRFLERHGPATKARLVLLLALNTGMARQDLTRVGWQHVKAGRIAYRRAKTSVAADLPILPDLAEELARIPADRLLFIVQDERPVGYKPETLGNWFRERCIEAGVPGRLHGLRKAGAVRLADAGASDWEIASYLAHTDTREASTYAKKANRAKLADSGFAKMLNVSNLSAALDKKAKKPNE